MSTARTGHETAATLSEQGVATPCSMGTDMAFYHITWVTHNSRLSRRMIEYHITPGEPVLLDELAEEYITKIIAEIVLSGATKKEATAPCYCIYAYNICRDHVHMIIGCQRENIFDIIRLLKGKSAQRYKEYLGIDARREFHLWAQKYNKWLIKSEEQFRNTISYVIWNRHKHGLTQNKGLQPLVLSMIQSCGNAEYVAEYEHELNRIYECSKSMRDEEYGLTEDEIRIVEGE